MTHGQDANRRSPAAVVSTVVALTLLAIATISLQVVGNAEPQAVAGIRPVSPPSAQHGAAIERARALVAEAMDAGHVGLAVAVGVDGTIVWSEGFGQANVELKVPVTPLSRFRVGSVSKPLTAAAVGLLVQEGRLDLDAPVQTYVPGFPVKTHPITTRQLGGHLAGIRHYAGDEFLSTRYFDSVAAGLSIFADDPLLFEPGTAYSYSSYGWNLISAVIEAASGEDFLRMMDRRVFAPLGMLSTTADINHLLVPDRVSFYHQDDDGRVRNAPYVDNSYKWAGGGFLSTMDDLVRFGSAHLDAGFLEGATLETLFTSQATRDGDATGYGFGWRVSEDERGRVVGHTGGSVGGTTALVVLRDARVVVAMASNLSNAPRIPIDDVAELFID